MSLIEKLEGVLAAVSPLSSKSTPTDVMRASAKALDLLRDHGPAIRQAMIDARRYREVRAICCSAEGPSDELASAWMTGDEAATDLAADMARATGEGEGHDPR